MYWASKAPKKINQIIAALGLALISAGPAAFAEEKSMDPHEFVKRIEFNSQTMPPEVMRAMQENMKMMQKFRGIHFEEKPDITEERLRRYPQATDFNFAYIDRSGNVKLETALLVADSFHDGVAIVCPGRFHRVDGMWEMQLEDYRPRQKRCALLQTDGTVSFLKPFEVPVGHFDKDGIAVTALSDKSKYTLRKANGEVILNISATGIGEWGEGLLPVEAPMTNVNLDALKQDPRLIAVLPAVHVNTSGWGYVNRDNKQVIPTKFSSAGPFSEGMAAVCPAGNDILSKASAALGQARENPTAEAMASVQNLFSQNWLQSNSQA